MTWFDVCPNLGIAHVTFEIVKEWQAIKIMYLEQNVGKIYVDTNIIAEYVKHVFIVYIKRRD